MEAETSHMSPQSDSSYESSGKFQFLQKKSFWERFGFRRSERPDYDKAEIHTWNGDDDPENPFNWSKTYKWILTLTGSFMSVIVALPAGSYSAGKIYMAEEFHIQEKPFPNLMWATFSFQLGAAFLPAICVPMSETWGRMPSYFVGYSVLVISLFPSAFAQNYATLVVTRFFGGGAAASTINIVGGSISDVWRGSVARSHPMSVYIFSTAVGISLGSFIGGGLQRIHIGQPWRWIFYVQLMWGFALMPVFYFILYETRGDVILSKRAKKLRLQTGRPIYSKFELELPGLMQRLKVSTTRPTWMLLTEPVVLFFTLWLSFAWGILFVYFDSVYLTFHHNYKWDVFTVGLAELSILVGTFIGLAFDPIQAAIYRRSAKKNPNRSGDIESAGSDSQGYGKPIPEARLYTSIPGSIIFAAGLFWYGWGSVGEGSKHWIIPTLGIGCTGVGIYSILMAVNNFLIDAYEKYAASALSATSLGRNIISAAVPLSSTALFTHLGYGWAGSLLGFIGLGLSLVPVVLVWKGPAIRRRSPFMRESMFE